MNHKPSTSLLLLLLLSAFILHSSAFAQGLNAKISSAEPKFVAYKFVTLATGTAVQASVTNLQFTAATFYGYKTAATNAAPTANTDAAYIGFRDAAGNVVAADAPAFNDTITAGSWLGLSAIGTKYNLRDIFFVGSTGDKILIVYTQ